MNLVIFFRRKENYLRELQGFKILDFDIITPLNFLGNLERDLIREYNKILRQEEVLGFQKSRVNWLALGERNTKFYHLTTLNRRRRNKINTKNSGR